MGRGECSAAITLKLQTKLKLDMADVVENQKLNNFV